MSAVKHILKLMNLYKILERQGCLYKTKINYTWSKRQKSFGTSALFGGTSLQHDSAIRVIMRNAARGLIYKGLFCTCLCVRRVVSLAEAYYFVQSILNQSQE